MYFGLYLYQFKIHVSYMYAGPLPAAAGLLLPIIPTGFIHSFISPASRGQRPTQRGRTAFRAPSAIRYYPVLWLLFMCRPPGSSPSVGHQSTSEQNGFHKSCISGPDFCCVHI